MNCHKMSGGYLNGQAEPGIFSLEIFTNVTSMQNAPRAISVFRRPMIGSRTSVVPRINTTIRSPCQILRVDRPADNL